MKRLVRFGALILILVLLPSMMLSSCGLILGLKSTVHFQSGDFTVPNRKSTIQSGFRSGRKAFNKNDVEVRWYYAFHSSDKTFDEANCLYYHGTSETAFFAMYVSNVAFPNVEFYKPYDDYKQLPDCRLLKTISFDEASTGKYTYTFNDILFCVTYDHYEMIKIPAECFVDNKLEQLTITLWLVRINEEGKYVLDTNRSETTISYDIIGDYVVLLW